jgi:hypothetical protein
MSKLRGHGGIASQTERLKKLGAKVTKEIPADLLEVE